MIAGAKYARPAIFDNTAGATLLLSKNNKINIKKHSKNIFFEKWIYNVYK